VCDLVILSIGTLWLHAASTKLAGRSSLANACTRES
jgi:hypothetical protein